MRQLIDIVSLSVLLVFLTIGVFCCLVALVASAITNLQAVYAQYPQATQYIGLLLLFLLSTNGLMILRRQLH